MYNLQHIKKIADSKKATIRDIASYCGISDTGLHKSIAKNNINVDTLDKIAEYLNTSISELIGEEHKGLSTIASELTPEYGMHDNPYKALYEMQKEVNDMIKENADLRVENERLKNVTAPGIGAMTG